MGKRRKRASSSVCPFVECASRGAWPRRRVSIGQRRCAARQGARDALSARVLTATDWLRELLAAVSGTQLCRVKRKVCVAVCAKGVLSSENEMTVRWICNTEPVQEAVNLLGVSWCP